MSRLGIIGATALSLMLAAATPALAQHVRGAGGGGGGAVRAGGMGGGMHASGANFGGGGAFRGAQASVGGANSAGRGPQFTTGRSGGQFAQGQSAQRQFTQGQFAGNRSGFRDRDHDGRFGRGAGFVAGLALGSAYGYGAYSDPYYYGDDYAYDEGYDQGYPVESGVVVSSAGGDASYCAQRYRSYDPSSGTYLGFDGLRHPCL